MGMAAVQQKDLTDFRTGEIANNAEAHRLHIPVIPRAEMLALVDPSRQEIPEYAAHLAEIADNEAASGQPAAAS